MTQNPGEEKPRRKPRTSPDEGAAYTLAVMEEVGRLRRGRKWSAERLAEEMAKAGVPWTRDTVTNLESGRRKRVAMHEVLALAYVLGVDNPVDLIVPRRGDDGETMFPLTPEVIVAAESVRAWFRGETGPLKDALAGSLRDETDAWLRKVLGDDTPEEVRRGVLSVIRSGVLLDELARPGRAEAIVAEMPEDTRQKIAEMLARDTDGEG